MPKDNLIGDRGNPTSHTALVHVAGAVVSPRPGAVPLALIAAFAHGASPGVGPLFARREREPEFETHRIHETAIDVGVSRRYREGRGRACNNFGRTEGSSPMARGSAEAPSIDGTYYRDVRVCFPRKCRITVVQVPNLA